MVRPSLNSSRTARTPQLCAPLPHGELNSAPLNLARTLLDRRRTLAHGTAATRRKLEERATRLTPPVLELDRLASLSLPTPKSLGRLGNCFAELEDKRRQLEQENTALDSSIQQAQKSLDALIYGEPIASTELITGARRDREEIWRQLQPIVLGKDSGLPPASRPAAVELYEARIIEADRLADTATRDADRVAQYNAERKTLEDKRLRRTEVKEQQTQTALDLQQAGTEWLALWGPVTASPATPGEMTSWIDAVKLLLDQRDPLLADEAELAALEPQIAELHAALESLGRTLALDNTGKFPTESLLIFLDNHLGKL